MALYGFIRQIMESRFDGTAWISYGFPKNNITFLQNANFDVDDANNIWFTPSKGVALFDGKAWQFHQNYAVKPGNITGKPVPVLGGGYVAPLSNGLLYWRDNQAKVLTASDGLIQSQIIGAVSSPDNRMWLIDFRGN